MSESTPLHRRHDDDARADDGAPTDAVTDDVREEAAAAESASGDESPEEPAATRQ